jgi:hypothetical protein
MKCGMIYVAFIAVMIEKFHEVVWTGPVAVMERSKKYMQNCGRGRWTN